jgi:hypothetical protein
MKITAALAKIPWKNLFRFVPGAIGIAGELVVRSAEKKQEDVLQRLEERQQELGKAVELLASRIKLLIWVAAAGLALAVAALIIALAR